MYCIQLCLLVLETPNLYLQQSRLIFNYIIATNYLPKSRPSKLFLLRKMIDLLINFLLSSSESTSFRKFSELTLLSPPSDRSVLSCWFFSFNLFISSIRLMSFGLLVLNLSLTMSISANAKYKWVHRLASISLGRNCAWPSRNWDQLLNEKFQNQRTTNEVINMGWIKVTV